MHRSPWAASDLLAAAVGGDGDAFAQLVDSHQPAIQAHCYRLLGSFHDAQEATQETMLRAWRSLPSYQGRGPLLHWLYRIATTTCLMMIRARSRRPATVNDVSHLEPYPDRLLDELPADGPDPAAEVTRRESVSLAFITALQLLPASQRAVLILRDVLAFPSAEVADILNTSVAAVNSAVQRARAAVAAGVDGLPPARPLTDTDRIVLGRFVDAWHRRAIDELAALLHEDVVLRMPPEPVQVRGRQDVAGFFATVPAAGRLDVMRLRPTRANGHLAVAAYLPEEAGAHLAYGVMVMTIGAGAVETITGFPDRRLFAAFDLPAVLPTDR
ncbi:MAG TPA: RNA polymerase subunit sigma-70 [Jiangellaceae bacterium]